MADTALRLVLLFAFPKKKTTTHTHKTKRFFFLLEKTHSFLFSSDEYCVYVVCGCPYVFVTFIPCFYSFRSFRIFCVCVCAFGFFVLFIRWLLLLLFYSVCYRYSELHLTLPVSTIWMSYMNMYYSFGALFAFRIWIKEKNDGRTSRCTIYTRPNNKYV